MAHELFGNRFFGNKKPAWHNLGVVMDEPKTASEAFGLAINYDIELQPMVVQMPDGSSLATDYQMLMRTPTPDDPQYLPLGAVGKHYVTLAPYDVCQTLDRALGSLPVETMGALRGGKNFFLTYNLGNRSVGNEEVVNYALVSVPYVGGETLTVSVTPTRVVCANTLYAGLRAATLSFGIRHNSELPARFEKWTGTLMLELAQTSDKLFQHFERLTQMKVSTAIAKKVLEQAIPDPGKPKLVPDIDENQKRQERMEYKLARTQAEREYIMQLFGGAGIEADSPECAGTAWGLFNAVAQYYDHEKQTRSMEGVYADALFGQAANAKAKVFELLVARK